MGRGRADAALEMDRWTGSVGNCGKGEGLKGMVRLGRIPISRGPLRKSGGASIALHLERNLPRHLE